VAGSTVKPAGAAATQPTPRTRNGGTLIAAFDPRFACADSRKRHHGRAAAVDRRREQVRAAQALACPQCDRSGVERQSRNVPSPVRAEDAAELAICETSRLPPANEAAENEGPKVAIKLLGHVWRSGATAAPAEPRQRGNEWVVQLREPSRWNPASAELAAAALAPADGSAAEPVWAETQPWCHD
jgi:hypothetical protein